MSVINKLTLGDRMKGYEKQETGRRFIPGVPVYSRIDGRSFSKFTRGFKRPYDDEMSRMMVETTRYLVDETHATVGYTQSDEISLAWVPESHESDIFFSGKIFKMTSNLAALATVKFVSLGLSSEVDYIREATQKLLPTFDARVCQMPNTTELKNMFIWRQHDAVKNAISMAAHSEFGHKVLIGLSGAQKQEKLFQERGINFNDYPPFFKRGVFLRKFNYEVSLSEDELSKIPETHRPDGPVIRSRVIDYDLYITKLENPEEQLFGKTPTLRDQ